MFREYVENRQSLCNQRLERVVIASQRDSLWAHAKLLLWLSVLTDR